MIFSRKLLVLIMSNALAIPVFALELKTDEGKFKFGGYIKLDYVHLEGPGADNATNRTVSLPGTITDSDKNEVRSGFQVYQTRFNFDYRKNDKERAFIEFDFFLSPGGNENITNSSNPRIRHAFFTYDNFLFGQTWSNFMTIESLPEQLDFGPWTGQIINRQAQVRYTGKIQAFTYSFSLENAETTWTRDTSTTTGTNSLPAVDQDSAPDITSRLTKKFANKSSLSLSALFRKHGPTNEVDETGTGSAFAFGTKYFLNPNLNLRLAASTGNLGRYGVLTGFKDAVLTDGDSKVEAANSTQYNAGVQYMINDKYRLNFNYGYAENTDYHGPIDGTNGVNKIDSYHINIIKKVSSSFQVGAEVSRIGVERYGATEAASNDDKLNSNRYIFSAQYNF